MSSTTARNMDIQRTENLETESQKEGDEGDIGSTPQLTKTEPKGETRVKKPTEKSLQFNLERKEKELQKIYKKLEQQINRTDRMIEETEPDVDRVREEYKIWMNIYENYCLEHNKFCDLQTEDQHVQYYSQIFGHQDSAVRKFKMKIQNWIAEHTRLPDHGSGTQSAYSGKSHHTVKSHLSNLSRKTGSSTRSSVLSARLHEEQRKLELTVEKAALKKKQELEKAKLKLEEAKLLIEQEQEELQMSIELDKATVKCKALKEMEDGKKRIEDDGRQNREVAEVNNSVALSRKKNETSVLNAQATEFVPDKPITIKPVETPTPDSSLTSIAKILMRPKVEIEKFSGNPLEYQQFMRQFKSQVCNTCDSDDDRLALLYQYTTGKARGIVAGLSHLKGTAGYNGALTELYEACGTPDVIASAYVKKALHFPLVKIDNTKQLEEFSMLLTECKYAIIELGAVKVLDYPDNICKLVQKLPFHFHDRWRGTVQRLRETNKPVNFEALVSFVRSESKKANDPLYGRLAMSTPSTVNQQQAKPKPYISHQRSQGSFATNKLPDKPTPTKGPVLTANKPTSALIAEPCMYCKERSHVMADCIKLKQKPYEERTEYVKSFGLCFACLKPGHPVRLCMQRIVCSLCKGFHPLSMHDDNFKKRGKEATLPNAVNAYSSTNGGTHTGAGSFCTMAIVPVRARMRDNGTSVATYAFMVPGSSVTFITTSLIRSIGGTGRKKRITLDTMGVPYEMISTIIEGLEISNLDSTEFISLPSVYTKVKMPVSKCHIPTRADIQKWDHLKDIDLPDLDIEIGLLIGNNIPDAYNPIEFRIGPRGTPHATRTLLGWIPWNIIREGETVDKKLISNRVEVSIIEDLDGLDKLVQESIRFDFPERTIDDKKENSEEDRQFLRIVENTIKLKDGHYEIALPFKQENVQVPNNRNQAAQRLESLKRKMVKDPVYAEDYKKFMEELFEKGHAEELPGEIANRRKNYNIFHLPHHSVTNPKKPDKVRVVFDAAAVYEGVSLNNLLLPGPNLTNNLIGVLLRFREEHIAILGDIESMFYQVRVPIEHRDFLRFLWWPKGDTSKQPSTYRMKVHLFGASSSPSCCNSALRQTAITNRQNFDAEAINTLLHNFYVDDCLKSTETVEKAIHLIKELKALCKKGGFNITKWASNNRDVLESVPMEERSKEMKDIDLDHDILPVGRALGVAWFAESDDFGFKIDIKERKPSRRVILSITSSVYDPLGLASPYILPAKLILQQLCQLGLSWDEQIPDSLLSKWKKWLTDLPKLEDQLKIRRCYKPSHFKHIVSSQLHSFADSSEVAYGCSIYLRLVDQSGHVSCLLVMGKARVAPLKKITIPRMELTAAVTAVRLTKLVLDELEITIDQVFYWTDSQTVLNYLASVKARFHTFVANRITIIKEASDINQWRYCPTDKNPADIASIGISPKDSVKTQLWSHGPDFLMRNEDNWPITVKNERCSDDDPEIKPAVNAAIEQPDISLIEVIVERMSSFKKIKAVLGYILLFIENTKFWVKRRKELSAQSTNGNKDTDRWNRITTIIEKEKRNTISNGNLEVEKLVESERIVIGNFQQKHFPQEFQSLKDKVPLKRSRALYKLDPYLEDGVIRVGGRLSRASIGYHEKHPVVIPKNCQLSQRIVEDSHKAVGHLGRKSTIVHIRQIYWIVGVSTLVRSILSKCVVCRRYCMKATNQKMADLPSDRLRIGEPPFTRTGTDFFRPFEVKRGRSLVKRYGVIFTCLSTRAIHLEVAHSLDTNSCINAVIRFLARRGNVKQILSDNGSNLVGAEKELRMEIEKWNIGQIEKTLRQDHINWSFNPPTESHFGGVWERMIRTVRKVLYSIMKEQLFKQDDESLQTLFCEVESIVNSRPLTELSNDPRDLNLEVLTPNHLLLLRKGPELPPGIFSKTDNYIQKRWRQIQYMADIFWKRWIKEYLPLLQERQKWIRPQKNIAVNDIVLLVDNSPRNSWNLGRVESVLGDKKGLVRIVNVKTKNSTLKRPVDKLCLILEADNRQ